MAANLNLLGLQLVFKLAANLNRRTEAYQHGLGLMPDASDNHCQIDPGLSLGCGPASGAAGGSFRVGR